MVRTGVVQIRVTPKNEKPSTIKALSISGVTWNWHVLNHAQLAIDVQEHFIEVPSVARLGPALTELAGEVGAELEAPLPDALVADRGAPFGEDQLNSPEAQAEDVVEPDGVADDLGWEAIARVGGGLRRHLASMPQPLRSGQRARS